MSKRSLKKNAALLGLEITWLDDKIPIFTDDEMQEFEIECLYETGKIVHVTRLSVTVEITTSGEIKKKIMGKLSLIDIVTDDEIRERIRESLPVSFTSAHEEAEYDVYHLSTEGNIFYVGISKDVARRYKQHCACYGTNLNLNLQIQEIVRRGDYPDLWVIESHIQGLTRARERERYWIAFYQDRGEPLVNLPDVMRRRSEAAS